MSTRPIFSVYKGVFSVYKRQLLSDFGIFLNKKHLFLQKKLNFLLKIKNDQELNFVKNQNSLVDFSVYLKFVSSKVIFFRQFN